MIMKMIAIRLMIPLTARKAGFWMLICGTDRVPATTARAPIMRVVVAVKFLSSRRFLILCQSCTGFASMIKPSPRIINQRVSMYACSSRLKKE